MGHKSRSQRQGTRQTLPVPSYIERAGLRTMSLDFDWADTTMPALLVPNPQLVASLREVSLRAILAYSCGVSEWIHYRLSHLHQESATSEFLEAIWAKSIHVKYAGYGADSLWWEHYADGWCGPAKGPIHDAFLQVESMFRVLALEGRLSERRAALLPCLASYLLAENSEAFHAWSTAVLDRLKRLYPRHKEDPLGDVVPRLAVDPDKSFKVEDSEKLIQVFLAKLDHSTNRFLSPPKGVRTTYWDEISFEGCPYMFVMEDDRRARGSFPS